MYSRYRHLCLIIISISSFFIFSTNALADDLKLNVVYPHNNATVYADSTFFVGSTDPGATLTINDQPVKVYPSGSFVMVYDLKKGINTINLKSVFNEQTNSLTYNLTTPTASATIPHRPLAIELDSIAPSQDIWLKRGDVLNVKFRGSTGYYAFLLVGDKRVPIPELSTKESSIRGIYKGSYTIKEGDVFCNVPIKVQLKSLKTKLTKTSGAKLTVIPESTNYIAEVSKDMATIRKTPGGDRLTPLPKGTLIAIKGKKQNAYNIKLGNQKEGWINQSDANITTTSPEIPSAETNQILVDQNNDYVFLRIPLDIKLPFSISEENNTLTLDIYGLKSDPECIKVNSNDFIKKISASQPFTDVFRISTSVNSFKLWGYDYYYDNNNLVLRIRKSPQICLENPLFGRIIAIDPGHGGSEPGSIGPTGVSEKTINLVISNFLKDELEKQGAKVIMTRTDDVNPDLFDRPAIAVANNAEILVSIHNNALPDGENPYETHGTSTYYYNDQAISLARLIQNSLLADLQFKDNGVSKNSLVLTRPTNPVSVLVEIGFMINPDEYEKLLDPEFQEKAAQALKKGIESYFKISSSPE